ncbi:MAG: FAD-binding protein [Coriobacteriales bacterium]|jgi:succinate dehydrogenase/fumarate reductase flavoprotein subunit
MAMSMDRRQFVSGTVAALGTAAAAGMGGVAMAKESAAADGSAKADSAASDKGGTAEAVQDKKVAEAQPGTTGDLSFLGEKPQVSDADCTSMVTADVIIVGGGHAGIQCAKSAIEGGLSVAVIERLAADDDGTYYLRGEDVGHFNSQWLINQGFGPYDTEEIVMEFAKRSGFCVNLELIRSYVENSGAMFDAMVDLVPEDSDILDYGQCNVQQCADGDYPHELGGYKTWAGTAQFRGGIFEDEIPMASASRLPEFEFLAKKHAEDLGAVWYNGYTAVVLDQAEVGGKVSGVYATDPDGNYVKFAANKAVVLAAGDFGGDGKMVWNICEEVRSMAMLNGVTEDTAADQCASMAGNPGTGHKMGLWAGGYLDPYFRASMEGGGAQGPLGSAPLVYVDAHGKRFMNECQPVSAQAQFRRTTLPVYSIWDANWEEFVKVCGTDHGSPDWGVPEYIEQVREDMSHVVDAGADGYPVRSSCYTEREGSRNIVHGANTLEELADMMGLDADTKATFLDTIAEYNKMCEDKHDTLFGRDAKAMIPLDTPPYYYYATDRQPAGNTGMAALCGLITDNNMNVLRVSDKQPIEGLYAAGNCLGGRYALTYATPVAGNSVGQAMTNGYVLGKYLAQNA